jgi:XTP/dITP diphosphohydrolase
MDLIIATNNPHKLSEIKAILGGKFNCFSLKEKGFNQDIAETGNTFLQNAVIKAKTISLAFGCPALADDSGLQVTPLNNQPDIHSAYYAYVGKKAKWQSECDHNANNLKLLNALKGEKNRQAFFTSSVVIYYPSGKILHGQGKVEGEILTAPKGANGFGYDPLFFYQPLNKTFAELSPPEKNTVSHRKLALEQLLSLV